MKEKENFFFLNFFCFVFELISMTNRLNLFFLTSNLLLLINDTTKLNVKSEIVKAVDVIETNDTENDVLRF